MKNFTVLTIAAALFFQLSPAYGTEGLASREPNPVVEPHFACKVILIAEDLPGGSVMEEFKAAPEASTHGGEGYSFEFGEHKVHVIADWRWLGFNWSHRGEQVLESVSAVSGANDHRVLLAPHPRNEGEQLSVDCSFVH